MKAKSLTTWFYQNDKAFGLSIMNKDPYTQGEKICNRYGFNIDKLHEQYGISKEQGDKYLLDKLNEIIK